MEPLESDYKMTTIQQEVFDKVLKMKPAWELNKSSLERLIPLFDVDGTGTKKVIVRGETYLVPIEDIICYGLIAEEVPSKYLVMIPRPITQEDRDDHCAGDSDD